jgi:hypothetical protein
MGVNYQVTLVTTTRLTLDSTESVLVIIRHFLWKFFGELELNNGEHTKKMYNIVIGNYL